MFAFDRHIEDIQQFEKVFKHILNSRESDLDKAAKLVLIYETMMKEFEGCVKVCNDLKNVCNDLKNVCNDLKNVCNDLKNMTSGNAMKLMLEKVRSK